MSTIQMSVVAISLGVLAVAMVNLWSMPKPARSLLSADGCPGVMARYPDGCGTSPEHPLN